MSKIVDIIALCSRWGGVEHSHRAGFQGLENNYHSKCNKLKKLCAFTMAEVMIVIGVIGIVSAITIPVLLNNANNKKITSQLKKTLSTLSQAAVASAAKFDTDYAGLTDTSNDSTCAADTVSKGKYSMCGLLNNTLSGANYLGLYNQVNGSILFTKYKIKTTTQGFDPSNFLLYSLANGAIVGFNPNTKGCTVPTGSVLNSSMLAGSGSLSDCIGFIDVNGLRGPNKEVTCEDNTSAFSTASCKLRNNGKNISDVYLVVFHNTIAELATNAGLAALNRGTGNDEYFLGYNESGDPIYKSIASNTTSNTTNTTSNTTNTTSNTTSVKTVMLNGVEYTFLNGKWYHDVANGTKISDSSGTTYTKTSDGYQSGSLVYDKYMNRIGSIVNGVWYDRIGDATARKDSNGNFVDSNGRIYVKTSDGYEKNMGSYTYIYDNDLNVLREEFASGASPQVYKGSNFFEEDENGNLIRGAQIYYKTSDGYEFRSGSAKLIYDNDLTYLGVYDGNGVWYNHGVREDENGNLVSPDGGQPYTKISDGVYTRNGYYYDEYLNIIKSR